MTKEQADLAFRLISDLSMCATAMDQYGNGRIGGIIRRAVDLLEKMVDEYEEVELCGGVCDCGMGECEHEPNCRHEVGAT